MIQARASRTRRHWTDIIGRLRNREYFKWARSYVAWLRHPLGVLLHMGFAALLCGLFVAPSGYVVFASVVAVILIGCVWPWVGIRGVACQLNFASRRTEEGRPVDVELVVTNRWPWPVWGLAVEGGFSAPGRCEVHPAIAISRVGGWTRSSVRWRFDPALRGRYPNSCPQLVTGFPFGMWEARRRIDVQSTLIVWPKRFSLPPLELPFGKRSWSGQLAESTIGSLGQRTTVREYQRGDSMRQIHWAKTALYDKLVSYDQEGHAITDVSIRFDTHPALHQGLGRDSSLEWVIRIVASICDSLLNQGTRVTASNEESVFRADSTNSSRTALFDWLAELCPGHDFEEPMSDRFRRNHEANVLKLHVTTDRSTKLAGNSIVVRTETSEYAEATSARLAKSWMTAVCNTDVPSQVRTGWRNGPRSFRHAV